jgi:FAD/FMN-containing dehydrogenase
MQERHDQERASSSEGVEGAVLDAFLSGLRDTAIRPDDEGYDRARAVWNGMIDRHPAMIVRCAAAADVIRTVEFARDRTVDLAVRGGGHNIAGSAVCEGGIVIDLSAMRSIRVDPANRMARVEPGVLLGEFDREAQAFGLATPLGINSTTGVAGRDLP